MKQLFSFLIIISIAFSCDNDKVKKPENFIPKEKMINLLMDMKIANKTRNIKNLDLKKNVDYMANVYNKHQVDSVQFKENNAYYVDNIEEYLDIYQEVERRLNDSLNKYKTIKKIRDSVVKSKKTKKVLPKLKMEKKVNLKSKKK